MAEERILSTGEAARRLGIPRHRLLYAYESAKILEPKRLGGRRVIREGDLGAIATVLGIDLQEPSPAGASGAVPAIND